MQKRYLILILCIITLMSIQFVSANDNTDNLTVFDSAEDEDVLQAPTETKKFTDLKNLIDSDTSGEINLEYNYKWDGSDWSNPEPKTGIDITKDLVINGNGATIDGASTDNAVSLFNIAEGVTVTLKNITFTHLGGLEGWGPVTARSVINAKGDLNIVDCTFTSNGAGRGYGDAAQNGSIVNSIGNVRIENSEFKANQVENSGLIYTTGLVTLVGSHFEDNVAKRNSKGGLIHAGKVDLIKDSYLGWTEVVGDGGGIYIENSDSVTTIENSAFEYLTAENGKGGAIYTEGKIDSIKDSSFEVNDALVGGAIYAKSIDLIEDSTLDNNGYARDNSKGGAIYLTGTSDLLINNSHIDDNLGYEGAGIYTHGGVTVLNSNLTHNAGNHYTITTKGGAIYANGDVYIENVDINYNFAKEGGAVYTNGTLTIKNSNHIAVNGIYENNLASKGGVFYAKGKVSVEDTNFQDNYAVNGGAIYTESGVDFYNSIANGSGMERRNADGSFIYAGDDVNIENSTVDSFIMTTSGSGVVNTKGDISVKNSTFTRTDINMIDSGSKGGAIVALGNGEFYNSNFTHNTAKQYSALYVGGTLDIYDTLFFNNTHGSAFGEGRTIVNNTRFLNNTGGAQLNGRVIGSNSTLNITNSLVLGTTGQSGVFNGTVFAEGNLYIENCTLDHNHAYAASSTGLVICTHSNATVINCEFYENAFSGQDCYGGDIYAGQNVYVLNSLFSNSTVYGGQGKTHGLVAYANQNITFINSTVDDVYSRNSEHGALSGNYVTVSNSNFTNILGFGANGAAIHANVANVSDSLFYNIDSTDNKDHGGAIYANNTYAYRNNFTHCHAGEGAAIFSENYTTAIENIFVDNMAQYAGQAIFTNNGFIEYNVILNNSDVQWGQACDVAFAGDKVDSLELNWWGLNDPFVVYGKDRAKTQVQHQGSSSAIAYLPDTWVIMKFFVEPDQPAIGQGVVLITTLEDYYNSTTGEILPLNHNIAKRTVIYNSTNKTTGVDGGKFNHTHAIIINEDHVLYSNNNFIKHNVSSTIDYQTLYLDVAQCEINVTKTVSNSTPNVGDIIEYTLTVSNIDLTDYTDPNRVILEPPEYVSIVISDKLDSRLQFISANDTQYNPATGLWSFNLPWNKTVSITIKVRVKGSGNITNFANITEINGTELENPYGANITIEVNESSIVILEVNKTVNVTKAVVGDEIKFTIVVNNTGTTDATDVIITDELKSAFQFVSATQGGTLASKIVTWTIDKIEPGQPVTLELIVKLMQAGNYSNIAFANCTENENKTNGTSDNVTVDPNVELSMDKVANVTKAVVGDQIKFTITVNNDGLSKATGVSVWDVLPAGFEYVSGGSYDAASRNVTWNIAEIDAGGNSFVELVVKVIAVGNLNNTVFANSTENKTVVNKTSDNITVDPNVELSLDKVANVTKAVVGDEIKFTITVTNNGESKATGVRVWDVLPAGFEYVSGGSYDAASRNVTWNIAEINSKGSSSVELVVKVVSAGNLTNTVFANSTENDTVVNKTTENITVDPNVELSLDKVANVTKAVVGDEIKFTITVTNNGESKATKVNVWDVLPAGFKWVSGGSYNDVTRNVTWNIAEIAGNGASETLELVVKVVSAGNLTNTVFANSTENDTVVNKTTENITVDPNVELSLDKVANVTEAVVGDQIKFTITVTNNGESDATKVNVWDVLPAGFEYVSGGSYDAATRNVTWNIAEIAGNGASETLELVVKVVSAGNLTNTVFANSTENDTVVNKTTENITVDPNIGLSLDKVANVTEAVVGDQIKFTITVTNTGVSDATGVSVWDILPAGFEYVSGGSYDVASRNVTWTIDEIAGNGASETLELVVNVIATGNLTNTVFANSTENDTVVNKTTENITVVPNVELTLDKVANVTEAVVGDEITFTITVTNNGLSNATMVSVWDVLPAGFEYVSGGDYNTATRNITWIIPEIAGNGASLSFDLVVKVIAAGNLTNTVFANSTENDTVVNKTTENITVDPNVELSLDKVANVTKAVVGDEIKFTITVTNNGLSDATKVNVWDVLPAGFEYVSGGSYDTATRNVTFVIDEIAGNGAIESVEFTVRVIAVGNLTNTVFANSSENKTVVNKTSDNITVDPNVELSLDKVANVTEAVVGDEITFTITVTNNGESKATSVDVWDVLPAGFKWVSGGSYSDVTRTVTWNIPEIEGNGDSKTFELIVKVVSAGNLTNTVFANSTENDTVVNKTTENITVNPNVELSMDKVANVTEAVVGDEIKFTITVTNNGESKATKVNVWDVLPAGFKWVSGGSYSDVTRTVTWNIPEIEGNGASETLELVVKVVSAGNLTNTVFANSTENDTVVNKTTENITVDPNVELSLDKVANVTKAVVGDEITFTITVTNNGESKATKVNVWDILPAGFEYVSGGSYDAATRNVTWNIAEIAGNGASESVEFTVRVIAVGNLTNTVFANSTENDTVVNKTTENITVDPNIGLSLDKVANVTEAVVGDLIKFTITVTNTGVSNATDVSVWDVLPAGFEHVSGGDYNTATRNITWTIDEIAGNGASETLELVVKVIAAGNLTNTVFANSSENKTVVNKTTENITVVPNVELTLDKVANVTEAVVGDEIIFTITVTNNGLSNATMVSVWDVLPAGFEHISGGDYNTATRNITWIIPEIAGNGASLSFDLVVRVIAAGNLTNTVFANSSENKTVVNKTTDNITVDPNVELSLDKVANVTEAVVGDQIKFTITVTNNGLSNVTMVSVWDVLPAGFEYVKGGSYDAASRNVTWTIDEIAGNGASETLELVVKVIAVGNLTNTVFANSSDNKTVVNKTTDNITVDPNVELSLDKVANVTEAVVGDQIKFTITVTNNGESDATNVTVWDILPAGFEYVSGGNFSDVTGKVTWIIPKIAANGANVTELIVKVIAVGNLTNTVFANSTENDTVVNKTSDNITVNPNVRLNVTKVVQGDVTEVYVGDSIVYIITVTNNGNSTATGVNVTEKLSNLVVVTDADPTVGTWNNDTKVWNVGTLAGNGASAVLTLTVKVIGNGTVTNVVIANSTENKTDVPANSTNVTANPDVRLNVTKVVENGVTEVYVGDSIVYVITVTNNGNSTATGVNVTEKLSDLVVVTRAETSFGKWDNDAKVWNVGTLPGNGDFAVLTLTVKVIGNGTVTNVVIANSTENKTDVPANSTNVTANPDVRLNVTKVVENGVTEVYVGDSIVYVITVTNNGNSTATGVNVTEKLSNLVVVTSATGDGTWNNDTKVWNVGSIASTESKTLRLTVKVIGNGTVTNAVVANSTENKTDVPANSTNVTANPDVRLNVTKVVQGDITVVNVGDSIVYIITVTNNGNSTATGVNVTEKLSNLVVVTDADPTVGTWNNDTKVWNVGSLEGNSASAVLTLTVKVIGNGTVANAVVANSIENITDVPSNSTNVTANPVVDLEITKTVDRTTANVGENITYTITVTNKGPSNATGVKVTEKLSDLVKVADYGNADYDVDTNVWTIGSLNNGETVVLNLVVEIINNGTIENIAVVESNENDTNKSNNNSTSDNVTAVPVVDLEITKTVNKTSVVVGDNVTYTITVTNKGPSDATDVKVAEKLSDLVKLAEEVEGYDGSVWTVGTLAKGETKTLTLIVTVVSNGTVANNVSVSSKENDTNKSNNNASAPDVEAKPLVILNITKTADVKSANVGENVTYTITVTNNGLSDATGVEVTEKLSDLVKVVDFGGADYDVNTNVWTVGDLAKGASATLKLVVEVIGNGTVENTVFVKSNENDTVKNTTSENVTANPVADLEITKTVDKTVAYVGETITYTIVVKNNGPSDATGVKVTEELSDLVKLTNEIEGYDGHVWTVGNLTKGESKELVLAVEVIGNGTVENSVFVKSNENDTNKSNNNYTSDNVTAKPVTDLVVTKTANVTEVNVGDKIKFTITVTNKGPSNATKINVEDVLPAGMEFVSATGNYKVNGQKIIWTIDKINNGTSANVEVIVTAVTNGTFVNVANVNCSENSTSKGNSSEVKVNPVVNIKVVKSANVSSIAIDDKVRFDIVVTNEGPSDATNVVVVDDMPSGLKFISSSIDCTQDGNKLIWKVSKLNAGEKLTIEVDAQAIDIGEFVNTVNVTCDENSTNTTNGTPISVTELVDVMITLSVDNNTPDIMGEVTFTLKVKNNGPSDATEISGRLYNDYMTALKIISVTSDDIVFKEGVLGAISNPVLRVGEDGTFTIDALSAGEEVTATIKAQVIRDGVITIDGTVNPHEKDSDLSNNNDSVTLRVHSLTSIRVNKTVSDDSPLVGDTIVYTITVTNNGPSNATGVKVTEKLPDGLKYVSDNSNGKYNKNSGVWNIGSLKSNETQTLKLTVVVTKEGKITNAVAASANEDDTNESGRKTNVTIDSKDPKVDIVVLKYVDKTKVYVGDYVVYTIIIRNTGDNDATNVKVHEKLSDSVKFISYESDKGTYSPASGIWNIGDLDAGDVFTLTIKVKVIKEGQITNTVFVTCDQDFVNDTPSDSVTINVLKHEDKEDVPSEDKTPLVPKMHATGNPIIVLLMVLALAGSSLIYRRK